MEQLIKIQKSVGGKDVVSARELYLYLGMDISHWAKWHQKNITENVFMTLGVDYAPFALSANAENQGVANPNPTKDFAITIDFAKRISMMAKTQRGEDARTWFIECEKKVAQPKQLTIEELLEMQLASIKENRLLAERAQVAEAKIEADADLVEFAEAVSKSDNFDSLEKSVISMNFPYNKNQVYEFMRDCGLLWKNGKKNLAKREYLEWTDNEGKSGKGWFRHEQEPYIAASGKTEFDTKVGLSKAHFQECRSKILEHIKKQARVVEKTKK